MKNPPGGPKPPLCPVPERLFGVSPAHWRKANCFPPVRNSAVLDQLAELIQTRRRLHEVETSCNLRAKQTKKWLPISLAPCRPSVTVREPGWLQLVPPNDGTDWIAQPGCLCPLP